MNSAVLYENVDIASNRRLLEKELADLQTERNQELRDLEYLDHTINTFQDKMDELSLENKHLRETLQKIQYVSSPMKSKSEGAVSQGVEYKRNREQALEMMLEKISRFTCRLRSAAHVAPQRAFRTWSSFAVNSRQIENVSAGGGKCKPLDAPAARLQSDLRREMQRSEELRDEIIDMQRKFNNILDSEAQQSAQIAQRLMKAEDTVSKQAKELAQLRCQVSSLEATLEGQITRDDRAVSTPVDNSAEEKYAKELRSLHGEIGSLNFRCNELLTRQRSSVERAINLVWRLRKGKIIAHMMLGWRFFIILQSKICGYIINVRKSRHMKINGKVFRAWVSSRSTKCVNQGSAEKIEAKEGYVTTSCDQITSRVSVTSGGVFKDVFSDSSNNCKLQREFLDNGAGKANQNEPASVECCSPASPVNCKKQIPLAMDHKHLLDRIATLEVALEQLATENAHLLEMKERIDLRMKRLAQTEEQVFTNICRDEMTSLELKLQSSYLEKQQYSACFENLKNLHDLITSLASGLLSVLPCPNLRNEISGLALTLDPTTGISKMIQISKKCQALVDTIRCNIFRFDHLFFTILKIAEVMARNLSNADQVRDEDCDITSTSIEDLIGISKGDILDVVRFVKNTSSAQNLDMQLTLQRLDKDNDLPAMLSDFISCCQCLREKNMVIDQCRAYETRCVEVEAYLKSSVNSFQEEIQSRELMVSTLNSRLSAAQEECSRLRQICDGQSVDDEFESNQKVLLDSIFLLGSKLARKTAENCELERHIQFLSKVRSESGLQNLSCTVDHGDVHIGHPLTGGCQVSPDPSVSSTLHLESHIEDLRSILILIIKNHSENKAISQKLRTDNESLKMSLEACRQECVELSESLGLSKHKNSDLFNQMASLNISIDSLEHQLALAKNVESNLVGEISCLSSNALKLDSNLKTSLESHSFVMSKLFSVENEVLSMEKIMSTCAVSAKKFRTEIQVRLDRVLSRNNELGYNLSVLNNELLVLHSIVDLIIKELNNFFLEIELSERDVENRISGQLNNFESKKKFWSIDIRKLITELTSAQQEAKVLRGHEYDLGEVIEALTSKNDALKRQLDDSTRLSEKKSFNIIALQSFSNSTTILLEPMECFVDNLDTLLFTLSAKIDLIMKKYRDDLEEQSALHSASLQSLIRENQEAKNLLAAEEKSRISAVQNLCRLRSDVESFRRDSCGQCKEFCRYLNDICSEFRWMEEQISAGEVELERQIRLRECADRKLVEVQNCHVESLKQERSRMSELEHAVSVEVDRAQSLNNENRGLLSALQEIESEKLKFQERLDELAGRYEAMQKSSEDQLRDAASSISILKEQIQGKTRIIQKSENEKEYLSGRNNDLKAQISQVRSGLHEREYLIEKYQFREILLQSKIRDMQSVIEGRDETVESLVSASQLSLSNAKQEKQHSDMCETESSLLLNEIELAFQYFDQAVCEIVPGIHELKKLLNTHKLATKCIEEELCSERNLHRTTKSECASLQLKVTHMHNKLARFEGLRTSIESAAQDLQNSSSICLEELHSISIELESVENWVQTLATEVSALQIECQESREHILKLESDCIDHQQVNRKVKHDLEVMAMELADSIATNLELSTKISNVYALNSDLKMDIETKVAELSKVNNECKQLTALIGVLNNDLVHKDKTCTQLFEESKNLKSQIKELQSMLEEKAKSLHLAVQHAKSIEVDYENSRSELNKKLIDLERQANEHRNRLLETAAEFQKEKERVLFLQASCEDLALKVDQLQKENTHSSQKLVEYNQILQGKGREIAKLHGNLAEARSLAADAEERLESMAMQMIKAQERPPEKVKDSNQKLRFGNLATALCVHCTNSLQGTSDPNSQKSFQDCLASYEAIITDLERSVHSTSKVLNDLGDKRRSREQSLVTGVNHLTTSIAQCDGEIRCLLREGLEMNQALFAEWTSYFILWKIKIKNTRDHWRILQCVMRTARFMKDEKKSSVRKFIEAVLHLQFRWRWKKLI